MNKSKVGIDTITLVIGVVFTGMSKVQLKKPILGKSHCEPSILLVPISVYITLYGHGTLYSGSLLLTQTASNYSFVFGI